MLIPNLRPKVVPHNGSRLLLGLIVRARRRLVALRRSPKHEEGSRPSGPSHGSGGFDPGDPRPMARFRSERDFWRFARAHLREYFPNLCTQGQFNRRVRSLEHEMCALQRTLAKGLSDPSAVYHVMDTTLVPAIVRVRASRRGLFCGQTSFGRNASKTEWVYGFKVALVVDPEGVVSAFGLAPASSDERPIGDALIARDRHEAYLADKGFTGTEWERRWLEEYGSLVAATPKDKDRRAWPEADRRWAAGKRQIIEGVIGQLKDLFGLERHRAKTLGGLLARQDHGLHLRPADQRVPRPSAASPGRPVDVAYCTSVV
jgi:hypothetical protein